MTTTLKNPGSLFRAKKPVKSATFGARLCLWCGTRTETEDTSGNPWCPAHDKFLQVMNYGREQGWPGLDVPGVPSVAIAPGYDMWRFRLCVSSLFVTERIYTHLFGEGA